VRKRWTTLLISLLGMSLVGLSMVSYAHADIDHGGAAALPQTSEHVSTSVTGAAESGGAPPAGSLSSIVAPPAHAGDLPPLVYVVGNRDIVLERPTAGARVPAEHPVADQPSSSSPATGAVTLCATVASARRIVVDENDRVIEVWSNTTGLKRGYYSLSVHEGSALGPEHPLTQGILEQYNLLLGTCDWEIAGRVY